MAQKKITWAMPQTLILHCCSWMFWTECLDIELAYLHDLLGDLNVDSLLTQTIQNGCKLTRNLENYGVRLSREPQPVQAKALWTAKKKTMIPRKSLRRTTKTNKSKDLQYYYSYLNNIKTCQHYYYTKPLRPILKRTSKKQTTMHEQTSNTR